MSSRRQPSTRGAEFVGTEYELEVTNIAHGGVCVGRVDGRVIFVPDAIPGERVRVQITDASQKSFWRSELLEVLEPSPDRQPHVWPEADVARSCAERAGGADYGHIRLERQRQLKREVLKDALQRFGGLTHDDPAQAVLLERLVVEGVPGDDENGGRHWRTRVRLHVDAAGRIGPYAARSNTVVPVASLPLAVEALAGLIDLSQPLSGVAAVELVAPSAGDPVLRLIEAGSGDAQQPRLSTVIERVGSREFRVALDGFWQVHHAAAQTLSDAVTAAIDPVCLDPQAANLDLYGGVGLFAAAVGDLGGPGTSITSVEGDERATDLAQANLSEWVGARALTNRVDRFLRELHGTAGPTERERLRAATVVLDPPRAGAGREVIELLGTLAPAQLIYVACDPVALARDVKLLAGHGYTLTGIRAFDLFPNTHHLEAVASFVRDEASRGVAPA